MLGSELHPLSLPLLGRLVSSTLNDRLSALVGGFYSMRYLTVQRSPQPSLALALAFKSQSRPEINGPRSSTVTVAQRAAHIQI